MTVPAPGASPAPPAPPAPPGTWRRHAFIGLVVVLGACEVLSTSGLDLDGLPSWLMGPIAIIGFLTFLMLAGPLGNPLAAIALLILAWRHWRWPLWRALLLSLPFWIVTWRVLPGPW